MVVPQVEAPRAFGVSIGQLLQVASWRLFILVTTEKQCAARLRKDGLRPGDGCSAGQHAAGGNDDAFAEASDFPIPLLHFADPSAQHLGRAVAGVQIAYVARDSIHQHIDVGQSVTQ